MHACAIAVQAVAYHSYGLAVDSTGPQQWA